jgi:phosphate transport system permease protein
MAHATSNLEPGLPARSAGMRELCDRLFHGLCWAAAVFVVVLFFLLLALLIFEAVPAMRHFGLQFLLGTKWDPPNTLGALPFIYGTVVTSGLAMLLAVPVGIASAVFLVEIAPQRLQRIGSFLIELLAAIPSVVYGFWAIHFLAPLVETLFSWLGGPANTGGFGLFSASLVLAVMIVPYVCAVSCEVIKAVPRAQREGSMALGATRWQTIWSVVLPHARPGIVGGCFLALGRALGETMAVIMIAGNLPKIQASLYALGETIPSAIALRLNESAPLQRSALVELGLVLLLVSIVVNCVARWLVHRVGKVRPRTHPGQAVRWWRRWRHLLVLPAGKYAQVVDRFMTGGLALAFVLTTGPLFLILGYITFSGVSSLDWDFFVRLPNDIPPGLVHALYGSVVLVALASLFAVPLGVLAAIFLAEYPSARLAPAVRFIGELLGSIPSIVVGIFAFALLVERNGLFSLGHFSAWAGAMALGLMMVPIVMRTAEEALKLVPDSLREASYSLGAARWQTIMWMTVPACSTIILTGVCLAIARIAGETAPLLLTVNQTSFWPGSLNQDFPYLTYYIYNYARSPDPEEQRLAWAAAFVLLTFVVLVNLGMRILARRSKLFQS